MNIPCAVDRVPHLSTKKSFVEKKNKISKNIKHWFSNLILNSDKIMFSQIHGDVPFWFLDVLNLDFLIFWRCFFCVSFLIFCVQKDCDINKYFYGKWSYLLDVFLTFHEY